MRTRITLVLAVALALAGAAPGKEPASVPAVVRQFCVGCHEGKAAKGGLDLAAVADQDVARTGGADSGPGEAGRRAGPVTG